MIYILRGIPGSGKSSFCNTIENAIICSADHFHMVDGEYKYNINNGSKAHASCFRKYLDNINGFGFDLIVDNTNTSLDEIRPYTFAAEAYKKEYKIIQFNCSIETSIARNIHSVPEKTIKFMYSRLQIPLPKKYKVEIYERPKS